MKYILKTFLVSLLVLPIALSAAVPTKNQLMSQFPILQQYNVEILDIVETNSLFMVKGTIATQRGIQAVDFYVTKDMKTVVFGQAFDTDGTRLYIPVDMKQYEKDAIFSIGSGKKKYYIFTDPECPYCHKMKLALKDNLKSGKYYFFLYPLSFHRNANGMAIYIIDREKRAKKGWRSALGIAEGKSDYVDGVKKIGQKQIDEYKTVIAKNIKIGDTMGVSGTPSVFDENGNSIIWTELIEAKR